MVKTTTGGILILGASGFIGRRVFAAVAEAGFRPIAAVRRANEFSRIFPGFRVIACDLATDTEPAIWLPRLEGIDAVINCAGVLTHRQSKSIHVDAPSALYSACEQSQVRRVIHISAISAKAEAGTRYAREKLAAETDLKSRDLDWTILRPSLVFAEGTYGGTSVLRGIAGLPFIVPLPGDGGQAFTPIHAEDLARSIVHLLTPEAPTKITLEPCGPESMTLKEIVLAWRSWLGLGRPYVLHVPMAVVRRFARIVDVLGGGPLSSTAVRQLEFGNVGDGKAYADAVGFAPKPMKTWLVNRPSSVQDKWHARLFFLRPVMRWVLGLSWIASGTIGIQASTSVAAAILGTFGLAGIPAEAIWATCLLDIAIGIAVLSRWAPMKLLAIQIVTVAGYTLMLSIANPMLWADPMGALVKNAVFLTLAAAVAALEDDR